MKRLLFIYEGGVGKIVFYVSLSLSLSHTHSPHNQLKICVRKWRNFY
jgi:hypothetical protein